MLYVCFSSIIHPNVVFKYLLMASNNLGSLFSVWPLATVIAIKITTHSKSVLIKQWIQKSKPKNRLWLCIGFVAVTPAWKMHILEFSHGKNRKELEVSTNILGSRVVIILLTNNSFVDRHFQIAVCPELVCL